MGPLSPDPGPFTLRGLFQAHNAQTSDAPLLLAFKRASGSYMYDHADLPYLDFISGIGVSNVGHGHLKIVKAIKDQADQYLHLMVYGEYVLSPQVLHAQKLVSMLPPALDTVYFSNSGSEAIDGALKLAKRFTGRTEIIGFKNSYHGSHHGALSIMGVEYFKNAFRPLLPDVRFIAFNEMNDLERIGQRTACVVVETIQGEAGVRIPDLAYMQALRARCSEMGALLILDEIQCGMGRTGALFAFEHYCIVPDILVLAKSLGGGMPLGAFIAANTVMATLKENPVLGHITTFGGHPVCCAAGLAALEVIMDENLAAQAARKSEIFARLLVHPKILSMRRKGLMIAIDLGSETACKTLVTRCIEKQLIVDWFLHDPQSLRIAPPLTISDEDIEKGCHVIRACLD